MSYVHSGSVLFQKQPVLCAEHAQTKSARKPLQNTLHGKRALRANLIVIGCIIIIVITFTYRYIITPLLTSTHKPVLARASSSSSKATSIVLKAPVLFKSYQYCSRVTIIVLDPPFLFYSPILILSHHSCPRVAIRVLDPPVLFMDNQYCYIATSLTLELPVCYIATGLVLEKQFCNRAICRSVANHPFCSRVTCPVIELSI